MTGGIFFSIKQFQFDIMEINTIILMPEEYTDINI